MYDAHNQLAHPAYQVANNVTLIPQATAHDSESLIRYDVEVSGFPSSISGHLVLLRLRDQDFPGAPRIENWPSWNLPILKWARAQGAVVGYAHSGLGLFVSGRIAARLEERPVPASAQPRAAWHLEHARIPGTRDVMVDVVVNGQPVARGAVAANGELHEFSAGVTIKCSSWVALRILPSGHTHPMFVRVAGKPVRASRRSAQWCLDCIDAVWREKSPRIGATEFKDAEVAYEQARVVYRRIALECEVA